MEFETFEDSKGGNSIDDYDGVHILEFDDGEHIVYIVEKLLITPK